MLFSTCVVTPPMPCEAIMFSFPKARIGLAAVVQQQMHEWDSSVLRPVRARRRALLCRASLTGAE